MTAIAQQQRTTVATRITTKVSQELMQTMLSASFGCISYLRGIFPDDTFTEERYNSSNAKGQKDCGKGRGQRLMRLRRDVAPEATKLLDYLEHGIFNALGNKYLASVILGISLDKLDENNVHEAYTFQFSYEQGRPPCLTIRDQNRKSATSGIPLDSAKRSMQQLFRQLITLTQSLSPLPDEIDKIISIRLFYNDSTPDDYEPPGFRAAMASESARFVTRSANTMPHDQQVGSITTGFHACMLKVTTLDEITDTTSEALGTLKLWDAEHIAKSACQPIAHKPDNLESSYDTAALLGQHSEENNSISHPDSLSYASLGTDLDPTQTLSQNALEELQPKMSEHSMGCTEKKEESKVLRSRRIPGRGVSTDVSVYPERKCVTEVTSNHSSRRSREKVKVIQVDRKSKAPDDKITCECGDSKDDGTMVQCDTCQGWSHVPCYGYMDSVLRDGYVHECFTCSKPSSAELQSFRSLAVMRRALYTIWENGFTYSSTRAFGNAIGTKDIQTANDILQRLVKEGWICQAKTVSLSTRKGSKASRNKPTHEVIKTPVNSKRLLTSYFDPQKNINISGCPVKTNTSEIPIGTNNVHEMMTVKNSLKNTAGTSGVLENAWAPTDSVRAKDCLDHNTNQPDQTPSKRKRAETASVPDMTLARIKATPDNGNRPSVEDDEDTTDEMDVDLSAPNSMTTKRKSTSTPVRRSSARIKRMKVSINNRSIVAPGLDPLDL